MSSSTNLDRAPSCAVRVYLTSQDTPMQGPPRGRHVYVVGLSIGDGYVIHSFRHSMRDRLRAVNCPSEMIDQIGGWSKRSVGEGYGEGFDLKHLHEWVAKLS